MPQTAVVVFSVLLYPNLVIRIQEHVNAHVDTNLLTERERNGLHIFPCAVIWFGQVTTEVESLDRVWVILASLLVNVITLIAVIVFTNRHRGNEAAMGIKTIEVRIDLCVTSTFAICPIAIHYN